MRVFVRLGCLILASGRRLYPEQHQQQQVEHGPGMIHVSRTASECGEEGQEETCPFFKQERALVALRERNCGLCRN